MRPQTIVERLDFVAKRIPGLKFTPPTQLRPGDDPGYGCFMSCDMYYIEIKVDQSHQFVRDVVISHGNSAEGISCAHLKQVLVEQDFETFAKHLAGLHAIYQIATNDKKTKQKAYPALTALETDLAILYEHQRRRTNTCHELVHKSPIGIMETRKGGLPVRLTYFITPYDLVDPQRRQLIELTVANITDNQLGLSATVEIEGASPHKLQLKSLISTNQHNSNLPAYAPFNGQNSEKLPAQFVLKLNQPVPMLNTAIQQIVNEINEPPTIKEYLTQLMSNSKESMIGLIARQELAEESASRLAARTSTVVASTNSSLATPVDIISSGNGSAQPGGGAAAAAALNNGLEPPVPRTSKHVYNVKLLDQHHTYHILEHHLERQDSVYLTKIPFTHPTSIPIIIRVLRQQALFNFVIGSCIRRLKRKEASHGVNNNNHFSSDIENLPSKTPPQDSIIFDVAPISLTNVCISFEHPSGKSLATLEIDFRELSCQLYALEKESVCSDQFATKILQKCWSIPVTLRAVLKKCNERRLALLEDANKRRERELQELLTNTTSAPPSMQFKSNNSQSNNQETNSLQAKFNIGFNDKSISRDLNSASDFSALATASSTANNNNNNNKPASNNPSITNVPSQSGGEQESANFRSNLLKKFSCKPKTKQTTTTKNQTQGNKILSLMLKRPNLTPALLEDANIKATLVKKSKQKSDSSPKVGLTTTKLLSSPDAARLANKIKQQMPNNQNVSLSLIRSPSKQSNAITVSSSMGHHSAASSSVALNNLIRIKANANGNALGKPRKGSIGAVVEKLVSGVTLDQNVPPQASLGDNCPDSVKNPDSSKNSPSNIKNKIKTSADQFAVKPISFGSLKLTVTKTKPSTITTSSSTSSSNASSTATAASSASSTNQTPASSTPSSSAATTSSTTPATTTSTSNNVSAKPEAVSKILDLGGAQSIKYTIPKISKTQQNSNNNNNNATSSDNNQNSTTDSSNPNDDSTNPSSSTNNSSGVGINNNNNNKRTSSTPFNRSNATNRNTLSSSTPFPRTTSNPLASASRPSSSTSANEAHARASSTNASQQQQQQLMRQQLNNRMLNLQHQQQIQQLQQQQQQQLQLQQQQQQQQVVSRLANPSIFTNQLRPAQGPPPMFALGLTQQASPDVFTGGKIDLNLIAANQAAALLSQQQKNQILNPLAAHLPGSPFVSSSIDANLISSSRPAAQFIPGLPQQLVAAFPDSSTLSSLISDSMLRPSPSTTGGGGVVVGGGGGGGGSGGLSSVGTGAVSSSSDSKKQEVAEPTISTPSSPTECSQAQAIPTPPLIPIDSVDEEQPIGSPESELADDDSDRLSIVDMNETVADRLV